MVKWRQCEVDHVPPSSVAVKNKWSCTSALPYAFMVFAEGAADTLVVYEAQIHLPSIYLASFSGALILLRERYITSSICIQFAHFVCYVM
jgi:hypothetical protein